MKIKKILAIASVLGLSLLGGQASADVSNYTANTNFQNVNVPIWLDLNSAAGNQDFQWCYFRQGRAAVHFSAETRWTTLNGGGLNARIWVAGVGYLNPANYFMDYSRGTRYDPEGHATHGAFNMPVNGWRQVRVRATPTGAANFRVDDLSLICMN